MNSEEGSKREISDNVNLNTEQENTEPVSEDDSEIEKNVEEEITPKNEVLSENENFQEKKSSQTEAEQQEDKAQVINMLGENRESPTEISEDFFNENEVDSNFHDNEEDSEMNSDSLDEPENELPAGKFTENGSYD